MPGPDGQLIFASVKKDGLEVMYQTRASVIADNPEAARELDGHSVALFITVDDIDAVERAIAGARWSSRATRPSTDRPRSTSANRAAIRWGLLCLRNERIARGGLLTAPVYGTCQRS